MDIVLLVSRLILSAVLAVAGVAKLYDREGSHRSFSDFGVPAILVNPLSWILPIAEILTAILLIPTASAWVGGVSGLVLLSLFSIGIAAKLARGEAADCHCFGKLQSGPIGWPTLVRNIALTAAAGVVVIGGWNGFSISALAWVTALRPAEIVSLGLNVSAIALLAAALVYIRRLLVDLSSAIEQISSIKTVVDEDYAAPTPLEREGFKAPKAGLPVGAPAPSFILENIDGELVSIDDLLGHKKPVMLLFVGPSCSSCQGVLAEVEEWQREYGDELTFALLSRGGRDETRDKLGTLEITNVLLQGEPPIGDRYRASWIPAGVLISPRGKIASSVANGELEVRELVTSVRVSGDELGAGERRRANTSIESPSLPIGALAPEFSASDLGGNLVTSSDLQGRDTLLMFWSPDCPWCVKMLEDISRWEANPPKGAPALAIVAAAREDEVAPAVKDIRSTVLIDPESEIAASFGASGTPTGILIDSEGRIASKLVIGVKDVLALAGVERVKALVDSVI